jgi:hypothetical protein
MDYFFIPSECDNEKIIQTESTRVNITTSIMRIKKALHLSTDRTSRTPQIAPAATKFPHHLTSSKGFL